MLVAAAFAPHPPSIVPQVAAGAAPELADLRAAGDEATARLLAARPDVVVVAGPGPAARWSAGERGSFAGYGVPLAVPFGPGDPGQPAGLPLSVTVGAWFLERARYGGARYAVTVPAGSTDMELAGWARAVLDGDGASDGGGGARIGMLVMADGSARRSVDAPGYLDPRAAGFDGAVAAALGAGDPAGLRALDPALATELLAAGVPAWRLAGEVAAGVEFSADLLYDGAPYGVGYLVASWLA